MPEGFLSLGGLSHLPRMQVWHSGSSPEGANSSDMKQLYLLRSVIKNGLKLLYFSICKSLM